MCGIIGYLGEKEALPIILNGLKRLEYRGYDSSGISIISSNQIRTVKEKGKIADLESSPELSSLKGKIGIGHTRWATHGEPNQINAHPHSNSSNSISIIHNGIIENHLALKETLAKEGYTFRSNTDSEVLAHLIDRFYQGDIKQAVSKALKYVEGTFGLLVIHKDHEKIIAARRGSPLVIGLGNNEMLIASDAAPLIDHTRRVIFLNDNEIAELTKTKYSIENINGFPIEKKVDEIQWSLEEIEKKSYKHFMLKEIIEQPKAVRNTLRGRIKDHEIKLTINTDPRTINRIIIVACGTSWHSALIGKYIIESLSRLPVEVDHASEFRYRKPFLTPNDLVIAISQSGETADTLAALKEAKDNKAQTLGIINVVSSTIAREVDSGIYLHAGPEIGVASTKAFTCQITALILLAALIQKQRHDTLNKPLLSELEKIPEKIQTILDNKEQIKKIGEQYVNSKNFLFLGRGLDFPVALEGALKLKEISYIHAEGYPAAEMKHGPIALIDENMPVVFLATKNRLTKKVISSMHEVKARKGKIIAVVNTPGEASEIADHAIFIPETLELLSPLLNVIPLQLLAYYIADAKGLDVDKPRNLAKSVTVE